MNGDTGCRGGAGGSGGSTRVVVVGMELFKTVAPKSRSSSDHRLGDGRDFI